MLPMGEVGLSSGSIIDFIYLVLQCLISFVSLFLQGAIHQRRPFKRGGLHQEEICKTSGLHQRDICKIREKYAKRRDALFKERKGRLNCQII